MLIFSGPVTFFYLCKTAQMTWAILIFTSNVHLQGNEMFALIRTQASNVH